MSMQLNILCLICINCQYPENCIEYMTKNRLLPVLLNTMTFMTGTSMKNVIKIYQQLCGQGRGLSETNGLTGIHGLGLTTRDSRVNSRRCLHGRWSSSQSSSSDSFLRDCHAERTSSLSYGMECAGDDFRTTL